MTSCGACGLERVASMQRCIRCGTTHEEVPTAPVDSRYQIERQLGAGAMGVVYLARDIGLNRRVALKMISPQFTRDQNAVARFRREAESLAAVRHENVVQIFAFGEHDESFFFAMEYVQGSSLEAVIDGHTAHNAHVPTQLAVRILERIATGLDAVHRAGLVHRDVKPANIAIEEGTGRAVVLDLGLVRGAGDIDARHTGIVGSPPYMAPEQILASRGSIGPHTDVYSLGCTAFETLTGRLPFDGTGPYDTMNLHLNEQPPLVSRYRPELSALDRVVSRAMAKDPAERHASCAAFAAELTAAFSRWRSSDATMIPPRREEPRHRRDGLTILIVDDEPLMRTTLTRAARVAFQNTPLSIQLASTGDEALARAIEFEPDLIVLDNDMPGISGVDALAILRTTPRIEYTPVMVVTGSSDESVRWRFVGLGVTEVVSKPAALEALVAALVRSAESHRAMAQVGN